MQWNEEDNCLKKEFDFDDFQGAYGFVCDIAAIAEKANHHPDICFGWGFVKVSLTTHSEGMVTNKDRTLASRIDEIYENQAT